MRPNPQHIYTKVSALKEQEFFTGTHREARIVRLESSIK